MDGGAGEEERTGALRRRSLALGPWTLGQTAHTRLHLSAWVSEEPRLSVCRLAPRLISQSASCRQCAWPVVGAATGRSSQIAMVLLLKERKVSCSCDVEISNGLWGPLLPCIHVLACSYGHLFTARLWTPRDSVVSREHVRLPLPCLCCGLPFSRLDYSHTEQAQLRQTRPWSQTTWAQLSALPLPFLVTLGKKLAFSMFSAVKWG